MRPDQRSSVHAIVSGDGQNAVRCKHRLGASNFFTFRRRVAPLARLEACSLRDSIESVSVCATVSDF